MSTTITKLQERTAALRSDRGATDPMLVLAGIILTLILVIGGTFLITNMVTSGKNLNAQNDLDKVAVAEAGYYTANDSFIAYGSFGKSGPKTLEDGMVGFRPTDGSSLIVSVTGLPAGTDWAAASESQATNNPIFIRTSKSNKTVKLDGSNKASASDLAAVGLDDATVATLVATVKAEVK